MLIQSRPSDAMPVAHDRVYRTLRTRIMHGELPPGEALTLRGIGKQFDVSMTPAREAVRRLVAEGALTLVVIGSGIDTGIVERADRGAGLIARVAGA